MCLLRSTLRRLPLVAITIVFVLVPFFCGINGASESPRQIPGRFVSVTFVPGNSGRDHLVTCDSDGTIREFDEHFAQLTSRKIPGVKEVIRFALSKSNDLFCAHTKDGEVVVGTYSSARVTARASVPFLYNRLFFSENGGLLVLYDGVEARIWKTSGLAELSLPAYFQQERNKVGLAIGIIEREDDHLIVTANFIDEILPVCDLLSHTSQEPFVGTERDKRYVDLLVTSDSTHVVGLNTASMIVWETATRRIVARPQTFDTGIGNRLAISGDGKILVCSKALHSRRSPTAVKVYDTSKWREIAHFSFPIIDKKYDEEGEQIISPVVSKNGDRIATLHANGEVYVWVVPRLALDTSN